MDTNSPLVGNDDPANASQEDPGVYTNAVLAGLYGVIAALYLGAVYFRRLPRTSTINVFIALLVACSVLRAVYFGIPNSVWQLPETPQDDIPRYTKRWWLYLTQFALYICANTLALLCYIQILKLWDLALCVVNNTSSPTTEKALLWLSVIYLIWQTWLIFSNLLLGSGVVLFQASISHMVVSIAVALAFTFFWLRLWSAMTLITLHRSRWQTLVHSMGACCVCFNSCCGSKQDEIAVPLNDSSQIDNVASARAKLTRFTLLATCYTASSIAKAGVMVVQMAGALKGDFDKNSWYIIIFLDYLLTEILVAVAVLLILWKPPKQPKASLAATAVLTSPDASGSRLSLRSAERMTMPRQQRQSSAADRMIPGAFGSPEAAAMLKESTSTGSGGRGPGGRGGGGGQFVVSVGGVGVGVGGDVTRGGHADLREWR